MRDVIIALFLRCWPLFITIKVDAAMLILATVLSCFYL